MCHIIWLENQDKWNKTLICTKTKIENPILIGLKNLIQKKVS